MIVAKPLQFSGFHDEFTHERSHSVAHTFALVGVNIHAVRTQFNEYVFSHPYAPSFIVLIPHMRRFINCNVPVSHNSCRRAHVCEHTRCLEATLAHLTIWPKAASPFSLRQMPVCFSHQLLQKMAIGSVNKFTTHASKTSNVDLPSR